jgi:predicted DNA-binding transcriptional regulator YafY
VLALLELLQAHHVLGGRDLAERLGVDERTVRRYAATLSDLGVPVTARRGRYGGYRLLPGYKLPPLMLTDDEAVAVVLGLAAAQRLGLATTAPATAPALAKIRRVLPAALAQRLDAVGETLGFTLRPRQAAPADSDTLLTLGAATRERRPVTLDYRSWRGEQSVRRVDPYGLVFHAGRWYLTAHDHTREQRRTFRLDRIAAVRPEEGSFAVPEGFDAVAEVVRALAGVPYAFEVEVLLEADLDTLRPRLPPTVGRLVQEPAGVLLTARADRLDGMAQLLAGLGCPFTVRAPDELRAAVAAHADRLASYARRA